MTISRHYRLASASVTRTSSRQQQTLILGILGTLGTFPS